MFNRRLNRECELTEFRNIILASIVILYSVIVSGRTSFLPSAKYYSQARALLEELNSEYSAENYERTFSDALTFAEKYKKSAYLPSVLFLGLETSKKISAPPDAKLLKILNGFDGFGKEVVMSFASSFRKESLKSAGLDKKFIFLNLPGVMDVKKYLVQNGICRERECGIFAVSTEAECLLRYPEKNLEKYFSPVFPSAEIIFSGSGNYHHLSYFMIKNTKATQKFTVVIFDAHTDYRAGGENVFDCGSWTGRAMKLNNVEKVILIGIDTAKNWFYENNSFKFPDGAQILQKGQCASIYIGGFRRHHLQDLDNDLSIPTRDVYLSLDLDLLSEDCVETVWGNGNVRLEELVSIIEKIKRNHRIIRSDICALTASPDGKSLKTLALIAEVLKK